MPESTGTVEDIPDAGGFAPFEDSFEYIVADAVGATDIGLVNVQAEVTPEWTWELKDEYDEASENWIDGDSGYHLEIRQTFGEAQRGVKFEEGNQIWQANYVTGTYAGLDTNGAFGWVDTGTTPIVIGDVANVPEGRVTILNTDTLEWVPPTDADKTFLMIRTAEKKLGFNQIGQKIDPEVNFQANAAQKAQLSNLRGPVLTVMTFYIFIDKKLVEDSLANGEITQAQYNQIKAAVEGIGWDWENLPERFEQFQIGGNTWSYSYNE